MKEHTEAASDAEKVEKLRRHVRILVDLGRLAGEVTTVERFLDQAVVQIARAVEISHVKILRYRRETSDFLIVAGTGWNEGVVRSATLSAAITTAAGSAFQTGEPTVVTDFAETDEFTKSPILVEHGIVALANVPLLSDGAAWGVLEVDSTVPRDFGEDTIDFLRAAGALLSMAVERNTPATRERPSDERNGDERFQSVLLREMQHRVKNNFQMILAAISSQRRRAPEPAAQRVLDHVASRINAISLAHDRLGPAEDGHKVALAPYLRALCATFERHSDVVTIDITADEVDLVIDRAVTVGLILNEAATNCVKHAFDESGGRISVTLASGVGYGEARLSVADNGRGMPDGARRGSGLSLIESLARQIGGRVDRRSTSGGTTVELTFPIMS